MKEKKIYVFYVGVITAFFLLFTCCKNNTNNSEQIKKTVPNITPPEVTLTLSETNPQSTVIISWTGSDDTENYSVRKMSIRDGVKDIQYVGSVFLVEDKNQPLEIIDEDCESDTEYIYIVSAEANGEEWVLYEDPLKEISYETTYCIKDSEQKSIRTAKSPEITLDYPKNVTVTTKPGNTNALMVSWDPVPDALYYEVFILNGIVEEYDKYFTKITETTETSYLKEHLFNERYFYFRVRAVNGNNYSLFSARIEAQVPKAENLSMNKAMTLINNTCENVFTPSDTLWFKCSPEKGFVKYSILGSNYEYNQSTFSIFTKDGLLLATGLPLFIPENEKNNLTEPQQNELPVTYQIVDGEEWIIRDIKKDLKDFSEGSEYILRLSMPKWSYITICIE